MSEKLKRPDYSRMSEVLKARMIRNLGKAALIILFFNTALSVLMTTGMMPLIHLGSSGVGLFLSFIFSSFFLILIFTFVYGMIFYFTNLVLGKEIRIQSLFLGFSEKSKRILISSVFFTCIVIFSSLVTVALVFFLKERFFSFPDLLLEDFVSGGLSSGEAPSEEEQEAAFKILMLALFCSAIFFLVFVLSILPFIFVWNAFLEDKEISFRDAMKKSFWIIHGRYFHYIGFVFYVCMKNIGFLLLIVFLNFIISKKASLLSLLLGFLAFIQYYTILSKIYGCIPVYYFSFLSVNGFLSSPSETTSSTIQDE